MNEEKFLEEMVDILDTESDITLVTALEDIEEWDSLSHVAFIAYVKTQFGRELKNEELKSAKTVGDLYDLVK